MEISYKYTLESPPVTKELKTFLHDFFKEHFQDFMNNKTMLLISPVLGENKTILQLDIDFKKKETSVPNVEVNNVLKNLNSAFVPYSFNLEITPGGCHIVSNFTFTRPADDMVKIKNQLSSFLSLIKNLDLDASFNNVPLKRIGYDVKRHFFYAPADTCSDSLRNRLFMHKNPYDEIFWTDYITNKLVPQNKNIEYMKLVKLLSNFESMMRGS